MTTIRVSHQKNYTCISNEAIRDNRLSFKARGLHHLLLSYPDGWIINREHLSGDEVSIKDGRTAIASALSELEELGYLVRARTRGENGQMTGWESILYETPPPDWQENRLSGFPSVGLTDIGKPVHILNTDPNKVIKELNTNTNPPNFVGDNCGGKSFEENAVNQEEDYVDVDNLFAGKKEKDNATTTKPVQRGENVSPPAFDKPEQSNKHKIDFEELRSLYNDNKPDTWAVCSVLNKSRLSALKALVSEHKENTEIAMLEALAFIRQNDWWSQTCSSRTIDTFLRRGNVTRFRESHLADQQLTPTVRVVTPTAAVNGVNFNEWYEHQHEMTHRRDYLKSATLEEFFAKSSLNRDWLAYAIAKYPDWNWNKSR